jgi:hypothetical protein
MKNCQPRVTFDALIAISLCQSRHNTGMNRRKRHPRIGSDFEDFLRDEGRLEKATAVAIKRVLAPGKQTRLKHNPRIDGQWTKEAEDRLTAYRKGELKAIPLQEVLAKYRVK